MPTDDPTLLILPGIGDSGPQHWQSRWQAAEPQMRRVVQRDWDRPHRDEWVATLQAAVQATGAGAVLVAHSLGCLLVAHWAARHRGAVRAALLVAVPDPLGPAFPKQAVGFAPLPALRLPFPSLVVASSDDPYGGLDHARGCAAAWGSGWTEAGPRGHLNADSGLGDWPEGRQWLRALVDAA